MINVIADRAMLGAFAEDSHVVTPQLLRKAAGEVSGRKSTFGWAPKLGIAAIMAALLWRNSRVFECLRGHLWKDGTQVQTQGLVWDPGIGFEIQISNLNLDLDLNWH